MSANELTLANLGGGAAIEKAQEELSRLVANVLDPNTEATAKRSVTVTITVKPDRDRGFGEVEVSTSAKLAPSVAFVTRAFFGRTKDGEAKAFEDNPKQVTINDFLTTKVQALRAEQKEEAV